MTQEEKDLLYKDLCTRLPYGAVCDYKGKAHGIVGINNGEIIISEHFRCEPKSVYWEEVKLYLFPLSSMTEEQKEELEKLLGDSVAFKYNEWFYDMDGYSRICLSNVQTAIDWFNKNHFDYRGLIGKELAIDCTDLNIY